MEYVWMNAKTGELHTSCFGISHLFAWLIIDQQSWERGFEQAEPPMIKKMKYEYLGEL